MKSTQIIKFKDGDFSLDVNVSPEEETAWLTKEDIALLYGRDRTVISRHISNIFKESELDESTSVHFLHISPGSSSPKHRPPQYYNLDVIIAVGYRIKSNRGLLLRTFVNDYFMSLCDVQVYDYSRSIIYNNGEISLSVNIAPEEDTVYLNEMQIGILFGTSRQNINLHIQNITKDGELPINSVRKDYLHTAQDGKKYSVAFYNLDMILAIGYRARSKQAIDFRKWASSILKQFITKGYAISDKRCLECKNSILDLQVKYLELEAKQNSSIIFKPGDQLNAFWGVQKFLQSAKKEILIIDNYFGHAFDEVLGEINVDKAIITNVNNSKIDTCKNYKVIKNNIFHDRFIIVDDYCYHFGSSIEDVGKNISVGQRINEITIVNFLKTFRS